ncbi:MAG TPA: hypothetical protein H9887_02955 [Candidatus Dorea intestinavium]|nr:hypothetical protein [Candidatus Dorea intestinavium]
MRKKQKLVKTKYGQEKIGPSRGGLKSIIMAVIVLLLLIASLLLSFFLKGNISVIMGILGFLCIYFAVRGINYGLKGFKERNKRYETCKVGIGMNVGLIFVFVLLFVRGLVS